MLHSPPATMFSELCRDTLKRSVLEGLHAFQELLAASRARDSTLNNNYNNNNNNNLISDTSDSTYCPSDGSLSSSDEEEDSNGNVNSKLPIVANRRLQRESK